MTDLSLAFTAILCDDELPLHITTGAYLLAYGLWVMMGEREGEA
jgi:hypothetical protein